MESENRIAVDGRNCWRHASAQRLSFLVDGAAYFPALAAALERAEHSIVIVGWDLHSRLPLRRQGDGAQEAHDLASLLTGLVTHRRQLHVHLLVWDFAMIFALEREIVPVFRVPWNAPHRLHFRYDAEHPVGACHHQKIVVIDDSIAFIGGMDLTAARWDTRAHRPDDRRRIDPWGRSYEPFHDVQVALEGDAAAVLGDLVRERWRRSTGARLRPPPGRGNRWPPGVAPSMRDVDVAVARTEPAGAGRSEVREVERLYVDSITAARHCIYIENQYLTSSVIGDALEARLRSMNSPEIVIVSPRQCSGWLEQATMGGLRTRWLERLRAADRNRRLHVYAPVADQASGVSVNVHAKVMVVDDRFVRVGSANLSNRSMGFDTECDIAVEANGRAEVRQAITAFRNDLVAEHLGSTCSRVAEEIREHGSLTTAIEALRGGDRTLTVLDDAGESALVDMVPEAPLLDPERPVTPEKFLDMLMPEESTEARRGPAFRIGLAIAAMLGLAALWHFTPLAAWLQPERLAEASATLEQDAFGRLWAIAAFVAASLLMVPVTVLVAASGLVFGPLEGFAVAVIGSLVSALLAHTLGRYLWRDAVRRLGGKRLNRISRRLAGSGVLVVAAVRMVPLAPFTVVNLVAGCIHIRPGTFALATLLGMCPGILALTLLSNQAVQVLTHPNWQTAGTAFAMLVVAAGGLYAFHRALQRTADRSSTAGPR